MYGSSNATCLVEGCDQIPGHDGQHGHVCEECDGTGCAYEDDGMVFTCASCDGDGWVVA